MFLSPSIEETNLPLDFTLQSQWTEQISWIISPAEASDVRNPWSDQSGNLWPRCVQPTSRGQWPIDTDPSSQIYPCKLVKSGPIFAAVAKREVERRYNALTQPSNSPNSEEQTQQHFRIMYLYFFILTPGYHMIIDLKQVFKVTN